MTYPTQQGGQVVVTSPPPPSPARVVVVEHEEQGPAGPQGQPGPQGPAGAVTETFKWTGQGPPGVIVGAEPGDQYLDTLTGDIYRLT